MNKVITKRKGKLGLMKSCSIRKVRLKILQKIQLLINKINKLIRKSWRSNLKWAPNKTKYKLNCKNYKNKRDKIEKIV